MTGSDCVESKVGQIRAARRVSVAALASKAGLSRQALYAIEAGTYVPNTAVSLRLASALETSVEELFRIEAAGSATETVELIEEGVERGAALQICTVGDRRVGIRSSPMPAYLPTGNAVLTSVDREHRATVELLDQKSGNTNLIIAGCDPAMSLVADRMRERGVNVVLANCSSTRALDLLKRGLVHVAGTHLGKATTLRGRMFSVYAYAVWEEGFVVAPGNPKKIRSAEDLRNARIRIINREEGAGSRVLLDRELRRAGVASGLVRGYDTFAAGHLAGAWYVKAGMADCCVAPRAAARAFQLDFVPLATERYELMLPAQRGAESAIVKLMDAINSVALRRQLSAIAGYDTSQTGKQIQ